MKKLVCLLLTLLLLLTTAAADLIWEPQDNFYAQHAEECSYHMRSYYINSPTGAVYGCRAPNSGTQTKYTNGEQVLITYLWHGENETWGLVEQGNTCWVPMDDLLLIYDKESFIAEHSDEFQSYDGSFEELCTSEDTKVVFWTFPCSGSIVTTLDQLSQGYSPLYPSEVWTDPDGRVWGSIGYYMGIRGWVCLSDPSSEEIPAIEYATYDLYPADGADVEALEETLSAASAKVVGAGVGSVAAISLALLLVFRHLKKKN